MAEALPKWVWRRYALLWKKFKEKPFTFKQALKELKPLGENVISVMFNELRKAGWMSVALGMADSRERVYTLVNPTLAVENTK